MNITTLFFDVGGVILTNGWDHEARERAAEHFGYDYQASEERHQSVAQSFECGQLSLEDYLREVIFFAERPFAQEEFVRWMESQSQPHAHSIEVLQRLKAQNKYTLATINNESRYLNRYRIQTFGLDQYFGTFFSSCYLGVNKPDCAIFQKALDIMQQKGEHCLFVDDRKENVAAAQQCGIRAVHLPQPEGLGEVLREEGII